MRCPKVLESHGSKVQLTKIRSKTLLQSKTCKRLISQEIWKVVIGTTPVPTGVFERSSKLIKLEMNYLIITCGCGIKIDKATLIFSKDWLILSGGSLNHLIRP